MMLSPEAKRRVRLIAVTGIGLIVTFIAVVEAIARGWFG